MNKKIIRLNEAQINKVVEESLRNVLGQMFGNRNSKADDSQGKELASKVIAEFEKLCKMCNLQIQFTLSGRYFGAVSKKSRPNGIDGDIDRFVKLVRVNWIKDYIVFDGIKEGNIGCAAKYHIDFDDEGYLSDRYSQQMMYDLDTMKSGWADKYKIPIKFRDKEDEK